MLLWAVDRSKASAVVRINLIATPKLPTQQQGERLLREGRPVGGSAECSAGLDGCRSDALRQFIQHEPSTPHTHPVREVRPSNPTMAHITQSSFFCVGCSTLKLITRP